MIFVHISSLMYAGQTTCEVGWSNLIIYRATRFPIVRLYLYESWLIHWHRQSLRLVLINRLRTSTCGFIHIPAFLLYRMLSHLPSQRFLLRVSIWNLVTQPFELWDIPVLKLSKIEKFVITTNIIYLSLTMGVLAIFSSYTSLLHSPVA